MNTIRSNKDDVTFGLYVGATHLISLHVVLTCLSKLEKAKLMIVDNRSDQSKFFNHFSIPVLSTNFKVEKYEVLNWMFKSCKTKYLVLLETDVLFLDRIFDLEITKDIHAHIIKKNEIFLDKDCIGLGFVVLNLEALRQKGINCFHEDVGYLGSWLLEKSLDLGISVQEIYSSSEDINPDEFFVDQDYFIRYHTNSMSDDAALLPIEDQTDQILRYYLSECSFDGVTLTKDAFEFVPVDPMS